ncbi:MAG: hypothetical protein IJF84_12425 [Thermoguttaceae bacterium]|nr:hypothetical protein [Thermoguttaceae bacterium]
MKHVLTISVILVLTTNMLSHYFGDELQVSLFADSFPLDDDDELDSHEKISPCPCCKDKENLFLSDTVKFDYLDLQRYTEPDAAKLDFSNLQRYSCHDLYQVMFPDRGEMTASEKQVVLIYKEFNRRAKAQPMPTYVNESKSECDAYSYLGFNFYRNIDMMDCAIVSEDISRIKELIKHGYVQRRSDMISDLSDLLALSLYVSNEEILDFFLSLKQTFELDFFCYNQPYYAPFSDFHRRMRFPPLSLPSSHCHVINVAAQYSSLNCFKKILKFILSSHQKYRIELLHDIWQDSLDLSWIDNNEKCNKQDIHLCVFLEDSEPLTFAIYGKNTDVIDFIVKTELQDPGSGIPNAIEMKDMDILKYLVKYAKNLNLRASIPHTEKYRSEEFGFPKFKMENGLHQFIRQDNFNGVKWLVKNGFVIYDYDLRIWIQREKSLDLTATQNKDSYVWYTIEYTDNVEMLAYFLDCPDVVQSRTSSILLPELDDYPELISMAANYHRVNILKYLCNRYKDKMSMQQYEYFMRKATEEQ